VKNALKAIPLPNTTPRKSIGESGLRLHALDWPAGEQSAAVGLTPGTLHIIYGLFNDTVNTEDYPNAE
jgi:hypothetical protein